MIDLEQQVKKANKDFYDIVGASYEEIDGRRSTQLIRYLADQLKMISQNTDKETIEKTIEWACQIRPHTL